MTPWALVFGGIMLYVMLRVLHLDQSPVAPVLYVKDRSSEFVQTILTMCPILTNPYVPTFFWGKSGHCQTFVYSKLDRPNYEIPVGVRHNTTMEDGSTLTFDLYEPKNSHKTGGSGVKQHKDSYCIIFCPGIGNSSESTYMRVLVQHAMRQGYTSCVLNHLGALKDQMLTAPRLFTYGSTEELGVVRAEMSRIKPGCHQVLVGLSMGANIVVKYLGEDKQHQAGVVAAVSFCQGYDVKRASELLRSWNNLGQGYVMAMANNQKKIIARHQDVLLCEEERKRIGVPEPGQVLEAWDLAHLDDMYTRKCFGFDNLEDFYHHQSSSQYIRNVETPMLIVNAKDDPIVPEPLLDYPKAAAETLPNCIFALTDHGGHLGYFENGYLKPNDLTWMDRVILDFTDAVTLLHSTGELNQLITMSEPRDNESLHSLNISSDGDSLMATKARGDKYLSEEDSGVSLELSSRGKLELSL